jgi:hypothetical protein
MWTKFKRSVAFWLVAAAAAICPVADLAASNYNSLHGKWQVEHRDVNGNLKGVHDFPNGIVDVGINSLLGTGFGNQTQITAWYIGIVDNSGFSAFANADTMASHGGWNEFTSYSEGVRQTWSVTTAASRAIVNSSPATFSISGSGTLKGIFVASNSTKSGTTGILWSTAAFASTVPVVNGDSLKVTYTVSG